MVKVMSCCKFSKFTSQQLVISAKKIHLFPSHISSDNANERPTGEKAFLEGNMKITKSCSRRGRELSPSTYKAYHTENYRTITGYVSWKQRSDDGIYGCFLFFNFLSGVHSFHSIQTVRRLRFLRVDVQSISV